MTTEQRPAVQVTEAGRARLQEELEHLRRKREPECRQRLLDLRDGSNPEDYELRMALEELDRVRRRIHELEPLLATAPAQEATLPDGSITIGSRVTARDESGREQVLVLVSPLEAGAARGHVSTASPVGLALLGRRAGDRVQVQVPAGLRTFTVTEVQ